jgi:hypothetical protein
MMRGEQVRITWYDGLDNYMSVVQSEDTVLAGFFTVQEWDFIKRIYLPVAQENDFHLDERGFIFHGDTVEIYTPKGETCIAKSVFFSLVRRLYAVLIEGANEDHHSVRYEEWWQAFIDAAYALDTKCDILSITEEEEIMTDRLSNR